MKQRNRPTSAGELHADLLPWSLGKNGKIAIFTAILGRKTLLFSANFDFFPSSWA
jgi:hypothetical protein